MVVPANNGESPRRPPATTPQGRENQLIAMAYDLAERQLLAGTVSSQVLTQLLRSGTERERLERLKLGQETKLAGAKVEQIESSAKSEELYKQAMAAFRGYQGSEENDIAP